mgnify:CR=1 FL=1
MKLRLEHWNAIIWDIHSAIVVCFKKWYVYIVFILFKQFQIVSNTTRIYTKMHALETLFSKCSLQFQIVLNTIRMHALETLFSITFLKFYIVSDTTRMHAFERLFSYNSLQFQIVSNIISMHALETLFSIFSLQFQVVSNTIRMHALETYCFHNVHGSNTSCFK